MALTRLATELQFTAAPRPVWSLIEAAQEGIERFMDSRWHRPVPGFYPSDFRLVYHALLALDRAEGLGEKLFCEWGSGFGVVAGIAGLLGCRAYGIESDEGLVEAARRLSAEFDLPARFFEGSFLPASAHPQSTLADCLAWIDTSSASAYEEIGLDPCDFALIYAYPWPGEEQVIFELFDQYAAPGALLLTYHGAEDLRLHRKLSDRRRTRRRRRH